MGAVSEKLADVSIVTNDNPRTEEPSMIAKDILKGFSEEVVVELDRSVAIEKALNISKSAPCYILIAGKGHETTQETNGVKKYFSDREEVLRFIENN